MTDRITIVGTAGTDPQLRTTATGRQVASLRVASTLRRQDAEGRWSDAGTNWYSVSAWGDLGAHVAESVRRGDPVIVHGRLRITTYGEDSRLAVEVDAEAVGHSLRFGVARFERRSRAAEQARTSPRSADEGSVGSDRGGDLEPAEEALDVDAPVPF